MCSRKTSNKTIFDVENYLPIDIAWENYLPIDIAWENYLPIDIAWGPFPRFPTNEQHPHGRSKIVYYHVGYHIIGFVSVISM